MQAVGRRRWRGLKRTVGCHYLRLKIVWLVTVNFQGRYREGLRFDCIVRAFLSLSRDSCQENATDTRNIISMPTMLSKINRSFPRPFRWLRRNILEMNMLYKRCLRASIHLFFNPLGIPMTEPEIEIFVPRDVTVPRPCSSIYANSANGI